MATSETAAKTTQAECFDVSLLIMDDVSLQDLIDYAERVLSGVPLSEVALRLSPDDLGVRIQKRSHRDLW